MIFSPFFTRFGRERPVEKPRRAVFSLVFVLEITGETAVFAKDLQKVPILRGQRAAGKGKVGKRVFFAGFPFRLSPVGCTRVRQPRSAGCAARWTMKGSWAKSRHVSRNSCALFQRSRVVLSPPNATTPPAPRRRGWGVGRGDRCGAAREWGAQEGAWLLAAKGERYGAMGTGRAIAVERGAEEAGHRSALARSTRPDQKRGPPPPGPPPGRPPLLPGCMGRKLPLGRSPPGWPSGRSGSLAPPKMLRR